MQTSELSRSPKSLRITAKSKLKGTEKNFENKGGKSTRMIEDIEHNSDLEKSVFSVTHINSINRPRLKDKSYHLEPNSDFEMKEDPNWPLQIKKIEAT